MMDNQILMLFACSSLKNLISGAKATMSISQRNLAIRFNFPKNNPKGVNNTNVTRVLK